MIQPQQVWLAIEPVDMRLGIDGLSLRVQQALGRSPCDGAAIAFSNRRRDRMKLLARDGTGVWLAQRRLLIAWVATSKYADHLPLYRIEQMAARQDVVLARSTLAEWMGRLGVALDPLAQRLASLLKEAPALHADETPVAQLDPGDGQDPPGLPVGLPDDGLPHRPAVGRIGELYAIEAQGKTLGVAPVWRPCLPGC